MSGNSTYQPRSPVHAMARAAAADRRTDLFLLRRLSDAAQPELLVDLRRHPRLHAGAADRHRRGAGDALHPACRPGLQFGRSHHARREFRLAVALRAFQRRLDVLPRRLHPHVPRHVLRLLQGAARGALDPRRDPAAAHDHGRLHGLRAGVGPDELLGRDRHHQPVLGHSGGRRIRSCPGCGAATRSAIRPSTASTRCTTSCPSSSPAWSCCTSGRCTWSGRTIRPASSRSRRRTRSPSRPTRPSRMPSC